MSKRKFSINRKGKKEQLFIEVIKKPVTKLSARGSKQLLNEIETLVSASWGKFDTEYIQKSVIDVYLLCLVRNLKSEIIALAPVKKIVIDGRTIYSFGLTVVHPSYRQLNLLNKMGLKLARPIIIENILRGILSIEVIFITPNIWTIGTVARKAAFIYPNPYKIRDDGTLDEADDETWDTINKYLKKTGEQVRKLDRTGSVMEGFYDDKEKLIVSKRKHKDKKLNFFGEKYLYSMPGREIVVRAKVSLWSLLKNV